MSTAPRFLSMVALLLVLVTAACSSQQTEQTQPPEIQYGLDLCDACGMTLDDTRFASATLQKNGEYRKFDDIGDHDCVSYGSPRPTGSGLVRPRSRL